MLRFVFFTLLKTIKKGVESNENFEVYFDSLKLESLIWENQYKL